MAAQAVQMINTELPDILELKNVRQAYKDPNGTEHVVIDGLNLLIEDLPGKGEFVVILGSSGCGKCVAKGTWIVTTYGLRRIEDVFTPEECVADTLTKVKDLSVIVNGREENISHKYYGGEKKTIKITTDNGIVIEGTFEHPLKIVRDGIECWKRMDSVKLSDMVVQEISQEQYFKLNGHRSPLPRAIPKSYFTLSKKIHKYKRLGLNNCEISKLTGLGPLQIGRRVSGQTGKIINPTFKAPQFLSEDLAYYFGLIAGDGYVDDYIDFTTMDSELYDFFISYTKRAFNVEVSVFSKPGNKAQSLRPLSNPFYSNWILKIFGGKCNSDNKDIPKVIRCASFKHQLAFIQGLMDTDGYSDIKNKRAEISLNSKEMIDFVCAVLSSLGILYTRTKRNKSHRVSIRQNSGISKLFRLSRKSQPLNNKENISRRYIGISLIEQGKSEVYDLTNPKSHSFIANSLLVHNSHILRFLSGLQTPTSGEILISGRPRVSTDYVGMVFQAYSSLEHYTVLENVALGLKYRGVPKKDREAKAMEMIKKVGLDGHENKFAKAPTLSGGQLQRVAIARSLAYDSKILLMDEPFGALDIETRGKMQDLLAEIWTSIEPTIIMVTHAIDEAVYLGDRIYVMGGSPSNIIKEFVSPLPLVRNRQMKREHSFIHMVQEVEDFMMSL
jgi:NitT/TauT family transport system ATP-binding protein